MFEGRVGVRGISVVAAALLAAGVLTGVLVTASDSHRKVGSALAEHLPPTTFPSQYAVPVSQVDSRARFPVFHPKDASVNDGTVTSAYVLPHGDQADSAVELMYPLPAGSTAGIRQSYLSVFEEPWTFGDPGQFFDQDIATSPDAGKRRCDFNNMPALCVDPKSASDTTQQNPAFLRLRMDDVSVELMGGTSVQRLIAIARTLARGQ